MNNFQVVYHNIRTGMSVTQSVEALKSLNYDFKDDPASLFDFVIMYGQHPDWFPFVRPFRERINDEHVRYAIKRVQIGTLRRESALWLLIWKNISSHKEMLRCAEKVGLIPYGLTERVNQEMMRKRDEEFRTFLIDMFDINPNECQAFSNHGGTTQRSN